MFKKKGYKLVGMILNRPTYVHMPNISKQFGEVQGVSSDHL